MLTALLLSVNSQKELYEAEGRRVIIGSTANSAAVWRSHSLISYMYKMEISTSVHFWC